MSGQRIYQRLLDLSHNLWWSWQANGPKLWKGLSEALWEQYFHNPIKMLKHLGKEGVIKNWNEALEQQLLGLENDWIVYSQQFDPIVKKLPHIAYFSAEFGLHESLATYSGGLGILAGDHLKSASDLGLPLTAIGLLYKQGYVQQHIDGQGKQHSVFLNYHFYDYPIEPILKNGQPIKLSLPIFDQSCVFQLWRLEVGRIQLILLDSDVEENTAELREITHRLYGGDHLLRIKQELLLGIGGVRALRALQINVSAYHLNEGHSSFLNLERLREHISLGLSWEEALENVRKTALFTTHTPVEAGHDRFSVDLIKGSLGWMASALNISMEALISLGHWPDEKDQQALFNMTLLAFHTCSQLNGVAKLHGEVSRQMFGRYWHIDDPKLVPIGYVTNGIHAPTWQAHELRELVEGFVHKRVLEEIRHPEQLTAIFQIPDHRIWTVKQGLKQKLIELALKREGKRRQRLHLPMFDSKLDDQAFTIGFARRFATYKRADLIFRDIDRLFALFSKYEGKLQMIFSGKAHPADHGGQALIHNVYQAAQKHQFEGKILLIEDYDMEVGAAMVQGCDIWLNNPRRPKEASGTSGMKAAANGTLNVSILDGWWPEGWIRDYNGWAIGEEKDYEDEHIQDEEDAQSLYHCLENEVLPMYFERNEQGIPENWLRMMKGSIASCTPAFHMHRQVIDYSEKFYQKLKASK